MCQSFESRPPSPPFSNVSFTDEFVRSSPLNTLRSDPNKLLLRAGDRILREAGGEKMVDALVII